MNSYSACVLLIFLTSVCPQSLYETNDQQQNVLNRGNRDVILQSLLGETEDLLKETMSKMQRCDDLNELRSVAYEGLLKMYSKGQFPNGRYFRLQCKLSHCIPCEVRYPKCEDKENGLWPQPEKGFSPWYMICKNNRTIETGYCPTDNVWSVQSFPYMGQCVHLFAIPNEYNSNGYLPSCSGKADGNYQHQERCDAYYKCDNGMASAVKCPNGTVFDSARKTCAVGGTCIR